ncbi:uncharacterized protein B0P05DRAFT_535394 [Gilbertella persicaria]|uniref:uncharacterized protein n=1 Tax=Gilbertella persicaria TaxID=101096 RepID=UPI002220AFE7|nr:uncharacterized protein B0P05DRAFT_535394 [Gilbertella persicaria]KAI8084391.1 hypothetical protein B0P05DRAFT_535394 [Gilbertella persicaria]
MGCCGSKEDHEEDAPLLHDPVGDNRMNYQTYETIDVQKEQEFWNSIIDKTTQNLIDISSGQTDPLQDNDVQERKMKYASLLDHIQPTQQDKHTYPNRDTHTILDILNQAKPNGGMSDGEVDWLYQTMDEIQDALQHIDIEPVGDMVVHLVMSDYNSSSSIRAY